MSSRNRELHFDLFNDAKTVIGKALEVVESGVGKSAPSVFGDVATDVGKSPSAAGVERFPPGSIVVQKARSQEAPPVRKNESQITIVRLVRRVRRRFFAEVFAAMRR